MPAPARSAVQPSSASCHDLAEHSVEIFAQSVRRSLTSSRIRSDDKICPRRALSDSLRHQCAQTSGHPVAHHGVTHRCRHHKTHPCRMGSRNPGVNRPTMEHHSARSGPSGAHTASTAQNRGEVARLSQPMMLGQHEGPPGWRLGRQLFATLTAPRRDDATTRAGPHTQPEAMHLGTTAGVRLESTLAHHNSIYRGGTGHRTREIHCLFRAHITFARAVMRARLRGWASTRTCLRYGSLTQVVKPVRRCGGTSPILGPDSVLYFAIFLSTVLYTACG